MSHESLPPVARPAHVPADRVVDFDVHAPPGGTTDLHGAWKKLHEGPDIVWAPYHGGHWIFMAMVRKVPLKFCWVSLGLVEAGETCGMPPSL